MPASTPVFTRVSPGRTYSPGPSQDSFYERGIRSVACGRASQVRSSVVKPAAVISRRVRPSASSRRRPRDGATRAYVRAYRLREDDHGTGGTRSPDRFRQCDNRRAFPSSPRKADTSDSSRSPSTGEVSVGGRGPPGGRVARDHAHEATWSTWRYKKPRFEAFFNSFRLWKEGKNASERWMDNRVEGMYVWRAELLSLGVRIPSPHDSRDRASTFWRRWVSVASRELTRSVCNGAIRVTRLAHWSLGVIRVINAGRASRGMTCSSIVASR